MLFLYSGFLDTMIRYAGVHMARACKNLVQCITVITIPIGFCAKQELKRSYQYA